MAKLNLSDYSPLGTVITSAFIALVSFGAIMGVLVVAMPQPVFSIAAPVICAVDETMRFDEWYDGESNQMRIYCVNRVTGIEKERTLLFVGVVLGAIFLVIFWAVWLGLTVVKVFRKKSEARGA